MGTGLDVGAGRTWNDRVVRGEPGSVDHSRRLAMSPATPASAPLDDVIRLLACPIHRRPLALGGDQLLCDVGHGFPVVAGIPVLLDAKLDPTLPDVFAGTTALLEDEGPSG